ncbi:MAG: mechanosensitive ion channel [Desulfuromonadaceae bacterium]|nr:mechanosensitive ion channel [Desulfuromonas sp.]MDY0184252.1 mechanosensitive ion channel [Desulfuromonadaceae bacterium]
MEKTQNYLKDYILKWLNANIPEYADWIFVAIALLWIAAFSLAVHFILHRLLLKWARSRATASRWIWQRALFERNLFKRLALTLQGIIIQSQAKLLLDSGSTLVKTIEIATSVWILIFGTLSIFSMLDMLQDILRRSPTMRHFPLRGIVQSIKLIIAFLIGLLIISILMGKSPLLLLSGLGAISAVMMLVFKDPILGLVAGIQLSANNMLAVDDWLEMPKFGADGDVIDISLTTVKVRNWDKTITTIPTYALISDSFKNWRGMSESGGRRIKRSLYLEISSVRFLTDDEILQLRKINILAPYLEEKCKELNLYNSERDQNISVPINNRRLTNIGTLRAYMIAYLKNHPGIHQYMTLMVRQLESSPDGIPMEIYAFTNTTAWGEYEGIQADIFDHFLAILSEFDIRAHETPTGHDLRSLGIKSA